VRYEVTVGEADGDLVGQILPRVLDAVRALIGEIQAVTATGVPAGEHPTDRLTVQLRGETGRHGEIVLSRGSNESASLSVPSGGSLLTWFHDLEFRGPSQLVTGSFHDSQGVSSQNLGEWDAKSAILRVLEEASPDQEPSPGLTDGTRAMEVAEAAARSLRRGRTIDLDYEEMSEAGNFKSVMTSIGCGLLLGTMFLMFAVSAAKSLGFDWAVYVAWIIPPLLVIFVLFQFLRFGIKSPPPPQSK
jgi:myo-inositol 2-dehydrogenase/D-chiro-inositol 1-dehydrogenase